MTYTGPGQEAFDGESTPLPDSTAQTRGHEIGAGAVHAYTIPETLSEVPRIKTGSVVTVRFKGLPQEKAQMTILISDEPKEADIPPGIQQVINAKSALAAALLHHNVADGKSVTFKVGARINTVEIIDIDGSTDF